MPKVSIIVPIYNADKYLKRCLESLVNQTFGDLEIIAVNDGSTDTSAEILKKFADADNRVRCVQQINSGVSAARNKGMDMAAGDYIGFVDPDDWIDENMYAEMHDQAIRENADIVMCTYTREYKDHSKVKIFNLPDKTRYDGEEVKSNILRRLIGPLEDEVAHPELLDAWGTVWSKLYRRELIQSNHLRFTDLSTIGTNEDSLFNIEACFHAASYVILNKPLYHYWKENTASLTSSFKPDLMQQWLSLYSILDNLLKKQNMSPEYYQALDNRICLNVLGLGLNIMSSSLPFPSKIKRIRTILGEQRLRGSLNQLDISKMPIAWKVFYSLAKIRFAAGLFALLAAIEWIRKK